MLVSGRLKRAANRAASDNPTSSDEDVFDRSRANSPSLPCAPLENKHAHAHARHTRNRTRATSAFSPVVKVAAVMDS
jgi:hypothetical protein